MPDAYVIEVANQTAGIVVREAHEAAFKFFSATRPFDALEGMAFADPSGAERAASHLLKYGSLPPDPQSLPIKVESKSLKVKSKRKMTAGSKRDPYLVEEGHDFVWAR
jgi:hypothetical protein